MRHLVILPYVPPAFDSLDTVGLALRSIRRFFPEEYRVSAVGHKPEDVDDDDNVKWIELPERGSSPHTDMVRRILFALQQDAKMPDEFILWHDDMMAVREFTMEELRQPRATSSVILSSEGSDNYYLNDMHYTLEELRKEGITYIYNYTIHCPVVYDTRKFMELVERFDLTGRGLDFEMLYFNEQCRNPQVFDDGGNGWRMMMDDLRKPAFDRVTFIGLNNRFNNREYLDDLARWIDDGAL